MTRTVLFWLAITGSVSACTTRVIKSPATITTRPLPELGSATARKMVAGESCTHVALFLIPVGVASSEDALAEALAKAPGADALVAYETRSNYFGFFPFYYRFCTEVHGYPVTAKRLGEGR